MSDFHARVMNIKCDDNEPIRLELSSITGGYRQGHSAARRAAAEIANEADRAIRDSGATIAAKDAEIARLRDALDVSALEYADAMREVNDLREHLEALVNVSEQSTIELARAALAGGGA